MTSRRWLTGLALAGAVAGCGGGDLDRSALADRADAICREYAQRGRDLGRPNLADARLAQEYFSKAADLAREQQAELEELEPAGDVQADHEALTAVTAKAIELLDDLAAASGDEDTAERTRLVNQLPRLRAEVDEAAGALGAEGCAG